MVKGGEVINMSTTRWSDKETDYLDTAVNLLIDAVIAEDKVTNISWENWSFSKKFDKNQVIQLNGRNIEYNMVKCVYDQISVGNRPVEDRTVRKTAFIIAYHNGISVNYIIDQNSNAQKMLRKLLSYTGKNEIEKNNYSFSNDFFVWLISKVYNSNNVIESNNDNLADLQLESIKGFRGDTEDSQTKVSATGETVMNIISTLSFLLESRRLKQIKLELSYAEHENISLILGKDSVAIDFKPYQGCYENEDENSRIAKLYLLVYLEILPILEQEYQSDVANETWNQDAYITFMNNVAENLTQKINVKIASLNE